MRGAWFAPVLCCAALFSLGCPLDHEVRPERELLITDLSVVESARTERGGPWTFGELLSRGVGADVYSASVVRWLRSVERDQSINGYPVPGRAAMSGLIEDWKWHDGQMGLPDHQWEVRTDSAPFRLLAIVNRIDLRRRQPELEAGELRFVFGWLDRRGRPLEFSLILEFAVTVASEVELRNWARAWHFLGTRHFGSEFNRNLAAMIERVVSGQNGRFVRLRTNEITLGSGWDMREFALAEDGIMAPGTIEQTPHHQIANAALAGYVNGNEDEILNRRHLLTSSLLGGFAAAPRAWNAPGISSPEARHLFSLATCGGCHSEETNTDFVHVSARAANRESRLSGYLIGTTVPDPVYGQPRRSFSELARRAAILKAIVAGSEARLPDPDRGLVELRVH